MKRTLITAIFFWSFALFYPAVSQKKKSVNGSIITMIQDTLACEFEHQNWKKQPAAIKVIINGQNTIFLPGDIRGFINPSGNEFVSHKIELFKYNRDVQTAASDDVPLKEIIPAAFLKLLFRGKISLYLYKDALNNEHFFIEKNSALQEIYIHLYASTGGFSTSTLNAHAKQPVVVNNYQYLFALKSLMQDCRDVFALIDKVELTINSLRSLMKIYDACIPAPEN